MIVRTIEVLPHLQIDCVAKVICLVSSIIAEAE